MQSTTLIVASALFSTTTARAERSVSPRSGSGNKPNVISSSIFACALESPVAPTAEKGGGCVAHQAAAGTARATANTRSQILRRRPVRGVVNSSLDCTATGAGGLVIDAVWTARQ